MCARGQRHLGRVGMEMAVRASTTTRLPLLHQQDPAVASKQAAHSAVPHLVQRVVHAEHQLAHRGARGQLQQGRTAMQVGRLAVLCRLAASGMGFAGALWLRAAGGQNKLLSSKQGWLALASCSSHRTAHPNPSQLVRTSHLFSPPHPTSTGSVSFVPANLTQSSTSLPQRVVPIAQR